MPRFKVGDIVTPKRNLSRDILNGRCYVIRHIETGSSVGLDDDYDIIYITHPDGSEVGPNGWFTHRFVHFSPYEVIKNALIPNPSSRNDGALSG